MGAGASKNGGEAANFCEYPKKTEKGSYLKSVIVQEDLFLLGAPEYLGQKDNVEHASLFPVMKLTLNSDRSNVQPWDIHCQRILMRQPIFNGYSDTCF